MIYQTLQNLDEELTNLGFRNMTIHKVPPIINRVEITLRLAKLFYFDGNCLAKNDEKWCLYYPQYVHFFSSERTELLGKLYYELIEQMTIDKCFDN